MRCVLAREEQFWRPVSDAGFEPWAAVSLRGWGDHAACYMKCLSGLAGIKALLRCMCGSAWGGRLPACRSGTCLVSQLLLIGRKILTAKGSGFICTFFDTLPPGLLV